MKYNINHQYKVIFFWVPKSGVMSLIKLMAYLKLERKGAFDELLQIPSPSLHRLYRESIFESWNDQVDYTSFKIFFYGRNPYHRIISAYIDKYVNPLSITPKAISDCETYAEFMDMLSVTDLKKEQMVRRVNFSHFCSVTDDVGWEIYDRLGQPVFDYISLLPSTGLPEARLTHYTGNIKYLLTLLNLQDKYRSLKNLYDGYLWSDDNLERDKSWIEIDGAYITKEELWKLISSDEQQRNISYASFYPPALEEKFRLLYEDELNFYSKIGHEFHP